ncbi:MAG TPA: type I-C CRISPR-associated protein Cas8c/Csd1 [Bacteroidales bacterium]|nr:type I-C CRISPR-associated protein Cas8c/Csd1 [Bacteroidales bacterium]
MSWIEELYKTYEACYLYDYELSDSSNNVPLLPLFHMLKKAHLDLYIDEKGNFIGAKIIESGNFTIIPCTEDSSVRTNYVAPHPLCEKLQYCAKDYETFGGLKEPYFDEYYKLLESWAKSEYSHFMLDAVLGYISKGTLIQDLVDANVLIADEKRKLFSKWPKNKEKPKVLKFLTLKKTKDEEVSEFDQGDLFVRWNIEKPGIAESSCWKTTDLFNSWISFVINQEARNNLCIVCGEEDSIAFKHPKGIRSVKDSGKLISSNDTSGFTFLGRFENSTQVATISAKVSQKAHSALRWLIDRQGFRNGDQVIVSWSVTGEEKPNEFSDSVSLFDESAEERIAELSTISYADAGQTFAKKLSKKIAGYKASLTDSKKIVVLGLDSAGPGRISITYYRELSGSEFLDRVEKWHTDMAWHFHEFIQDPNVKKKIHSGYIVYAPAPRVIAEACYGKRLDDKLKKATIERLLPCIIDGRQLPYDLVNMAVKRASNRAGLENWEWERALSVACALYSCHIIRQKINHQENLKIMALEKQRTDRDYLYGRLLAVAEHIEERALYLAKENRETNAARMMHMFSEQPFKTWEKLYKSISQGYFSRLQSRRPEFLFRMKNLVGEINSLFSPGDFEKNERLSGLYLLSYHCQRLELVTNIKPERANSEEVNNQ